MNNKTDNSFANFMGNGWSNMVKTTGNQGQMAYQGRNVNYNNAQAYYPNTPVNPAPPTPTPPVGPVRGNPNQYTPTYNPATPSNPNTPTNSG